MGSGVSVEMVGTNEEIVQSLLPLYYIPDAEVSDEDVELCKMTWAMITGDTSPVYIAKKEAKIEGLPISCLSCFHDR